MRHNILSPASRAFEVCCLSDTRSDATGYTLVTSYAGFGVIYLIPEAFATVSCATSINEISVVRELNLMSLAYPNSSKILFNFRLEPAVTGTSGSLRLFSSNPISFITNLQGAGFASIKFASMRSSIL